MLNENYFWVEIFVIMIVSAVLIVLLPKLIRFMDKFVERKVEPKKENTDGQAKNRYKTF